MEPKLTEAAMQAKLFQHHWNSYPQERGRMHCNNNNSYNAIKGNQNKAMGVLAGASDLEYIAQGFVCFIELKLPTGVQSEDQKKFEAVVRSMGHQYTIIRSQEAWELLHKDLQQGQRCDDKDYYDLLVEDPFPELPF